MTNNDFNSVLENGFCSYLRTFILKIEQKIINIINTESDPKEVRKSLADLDPDKPYKINMRYVEVQLAINITSFTKNTILIPFENTIIRLKIFEASDKQHTLIPLKVIELTAGQSFTIDESIAFYSIDIVASGILFEASDKHQQLITHIYDNRTLQKSSSIMSDKSNAYVNFSLKILGVLNTKKSKKLLLNLAKNSLDTFRWNATQAYCDCATSEEAIDLLKYIAREDLNMNIRNVAQQTLQQNGID